MTCTTLLVGKNASYDGSTIVARNEDSAAGEFTSKEVVAVRPEEQPHTYTSVIGHLTLELPDDPLRYLSVPDAPRTQGVWAAAGINAANVAMNATETIGNNARVLGADPLVPYVPAKGTEGAPDFEPARPGGLGEEDFVTVTLPYIRSAREGVERLGSLLARHGTYEMNGIAFSDLDEVWWMETVGGHHWIARRVPDDCYVTMPNQLGIDSFNLLDAEGPRRDHMASADLREWMAENHLCRAAGTRALAPAGALGVPDRFNPRVAFGTRSASDHVYNTPRAWVMQRFLNPGERWDGPDAPLGPESDDLPWCRVPEQPISIEDVKEALSLHYEGTGFDPYGARGTAETCGRYRPVGINRTSHLAVLQLRPYVPAPLAGVQWIAFCSNPFNALVPLFAQVERVPAYLTGTTDAVDSAGSFFWASCLLGALADGSFRATGAWVARYQEALAAFAHAHVRETDAAVRAALDEAAATDAAGTDADAVRALLEEANERMAAEAKRQTDAVLNRVLQIAVDHMRNRFALSDN